MDAVKFYNSGSKGGHERAFTNPAPKGKTNPAPKGKTTMDKKVGILIVYVLALIHMLMRRWIYLLQYMC